MSLVRLLKAGKSLVGGAEAKGRYHLSHKRLLPHFASKQNPFRATTLPDGTGKNPILEERIPVERIAPELPNDPIPFAVTEPEPVAKPAEEFGHTQQEPEAAPATVVASKPVSTPKLQTHGQRVWRRIPGSVLAPVGAWLGKPQAWFKARLAMRKPRPAASPVRPGKPLVQSELSLDSVKVVRNDLSDSDLEVVRARPRVSVPTKPAAVEPEPAAAGSWGRMGRWLGADKLMR